MRICGGMNIDLYLGAKYRMMNVLWLRPDARKVALCLIIFAVIAFLFLPVKENVYCIAKVGASCPPVDAFVNALEFSEPSVVGINWPFLLLELVASYIVSAAAATVLFKKKKKEKK